MSQTEQIQPTEQAGPRDGAPLTPPEGDVASDVIRRLLRGVLPKSVRRFTGFWMSELDTYRSVDRLHLKHNILPALAGPGLRILFVGTRCYCACYPRVVARGGAEMWTLDVDPVAEQWGAKGRHTTADAQLLDQHFEAASFDAVVISGVFGFGLDGVERQDRCLAAIASVLKPGGMLILGWNTDRCADPAHLPAMRHFSASTRPDLRGRHAFQETTHVFDCLVHVPA